jgi:hypothetical protein
MLCTAGLLADRKMVGQVAVLPERLLKVQLEPLAVILLVAVAADGVTLRRLVLVVLGVLLLVVLVAGLLPTGLIPVLVVLVVLALFASTLGKELT